MSPDEGVVLTGVSRFYGEILGVNNVSLSIPPGITSLVGSNGAGKTTLLNLLTGLLRPTAGTIRVCGHEPSEAEIFSRIVGYATQFDAFPKGFTGFDYLYHRLRMYGSGPGEARRLSWDMLGQTGLREAGGKRVSTYSKGMRQRLQLSGALVHDPRVLVLDEPLNGLDPVARAEFIALFRRLADEGRHVVVSSHILHEVDQISDHVVMMSHGYVVAEGRIQSVRSEIRDEPASVFVSCDRPREVARRSFGNDHVVEVRISDDPPGALVRTRDVDGFFTSLNRMVVEAGIRVDQVSLTDQDAGSVYDYLVGGAE